MQDLNEMQRGVEDALARGGSGAARQEAHQWIAETASQAVQVASEAGAANAADFARRYEDWYGQKPQPTTPRSDPEHEARARRGRAATWFLLALKVLFWLVFGPSYFNAIAWVAALIGACVSITLSLGTKSMIAASILKPDISPLQSERRLHWHVVAGMTAFVITFGSLFVLRGVAGPFALIGADLVLPILSVCDLVLLYVMGIASAYDHLYGWASPFVAVHQAIGVYTHKFEGFRQASKKWLGKSTSKSETEKASSAVDLSERANSRRPNARAATVVGLMLLIGFADGTAKGQMPVGRSLAHLEVDSTTSVYPSVSETMKPILARAFTGWTQQMGAQTVRVSTFERDGWLPRTVVEITRSARPSACTIELGDRAVFRGISAALERRARDTCNREAAADAKRIETLVTNALSAAWSAGPLLGNKEERSCTAFLDALAAAAKAPAGILLVIVSDSQETCDAASNPVPLQGAGANVIIVLVPSKTDMGPGVSAASRFNAKKILLEKIAPWLGAVLAPADVEGWMLPTASTTEPVSEGSPRLR